MYHIPDSEFKKVFAKDPEHHFEVGGRFEILGNHVDHNHGLCIVGCSSLKIYASVSKRSDAYINVISLNTGRFSFSTSNLVVNYDDYGTSVGIAKGVCLYLKEKGYNLGGFNAIFYSDIPVGAGISSSAAFEVLIGQIISTLFNESKIEKIVLAKAAKEAENKYFLKASGLLDQIGVAYGGINAIDFLAIENPKITHFAKGLKDMRFLLVSSGGSHSGLSDLYSSIPNDMKKVANALGVNYLRETSLEALNDYVNKNPNVLNKQEIDRATHFFNENERVKLAIKALNDNDIKSFLKYINESNESSITLLKNAMVENHYEGSPLEAIDYAKKYIGEGAIKINGGGFAGTIICFVYEKDFPMFYEKMKEKYGDKFLMETKLNLDGVLMKD